MKKRCAAKVLLLRIRSGDASKVAWLAAGDDERAGSHVSLHHSSNLRLSGLWLCGAASMHIYPGVMGMGSCTFLVTRPKWAIHIHTRTYATVHVNSIVYSFGKVQDHFLEFWRAYMFSLYCSL